MSHDKGLQHRTEAGRIKKTIDEGETTGVDYGPKPTRMDPLPSRPCKTRNLNNKGLYSRLAPIARSRTLQGYLAHKKPPPQDPTVGIYA